MTSTRARASSAVGGAGPEDDQDTSFAPVPTTYLNSRFAQVHGGLFQEVTKADVGDGVGRLQAQGYRIMSWADPWFPDPALSPAVRDALRESLEDAQTAHYTLPIGGLPLREAIADKLARVNGLDVDPGRNVLVTPGSDSGLWFAMAALLEPGDEVIVPDPSYPSNAVNCRLLGADPVLVPLDQQDGWQLDVEAVRAALTPRTRMVLLTHPNNPTGTVLRRDRLEALRDLVIEHDLVVVCDQAFEDFVFDGIELVTPAALPGMWERTLTVFSLSKGHGLSGLRVGYVVGPDALMDGLYGAAVNVVGATNTSAQTAAVASLGDEATMAERHRDFEERRHEVARLLGDVPGVRLGPVESGFLSWVDVGTLGSGDEVASHLLADARVSVNGGAPYGPSGRDHIRIVHGCYRDREQMVAALHEVADSLRRLAQERGAG